MNDLRQQIEDKGTSIETVHAEVPDIPEAIWHLLMTDCAERALDVMDKKNRIIDERLRAVLWVKRRWSVGEATTSQLNRARRAATAIEAENARRYPSWNYGGGVWSSNNMKPSFQISREGIKVIEYATRKRAMIHIPALSQFGIEWPWQRERLLGLCELSMFTDRLLLAYEDDADLPVDLAPIAVD